MTYSKSRMPASSLKPRSRWLKVLAVLIVVILGVAAVGWYKLLREVPQTFSSQAEYFKYGSIGTEDAEGLPYWVWLVLPRVFPEYLPGPGGYASFGVVWEDGSSSDAGTSRETPVGFSKKTIGFPRIGINCAVCHTGTYRTDPEGPTIVVPTAPAQKFDPQRYQRFVFACASDPKFSADTLLPAIEYNIELSWLDKLLYRALIIPATRKAILETKERYAWTNTRPRWGCGRIDPFNPVKVYQLGLGAGDTIGNSDMQPIWNMSEHDGYALHWDGLNDSLTEVVLSGAIGDGATPKSLPVKRLKELEEWLKDVKPPPYPFLESVDNDLVSKGATIFNNLCAQCHARGGKRTGTVIPLSEIGTDPHRLNMWTAEAADTYNEYASDYSWDFNAYRKTDGYVAVPLDGLWLRAPYLHNGSVPTLEDLLTPASERPTKFYRGYDVYSRDQMGFVHQGPAAEANGFLYDVSVPGNSNQGHEGEKHGTELSDDDKKALIEYLKTQ